MDPTLKIFAIWKTCTPIRIFTLRPKSIQIFLLLSVFLYLQFQIINLNGFSKDECLRVVPTIRQNLIDSITTIVSAVKAENFSETFNQEVADRYHRCEIFGFFSSRFLLKPREKSIFCSISFAQFVYFLREVILTFNFWMIKFTIMSKKHK